MKTANPRVAAFAFPEFLSSRFKGSSLRFKRSFNRTVSFLTAAAFLLTSVSGNGQLWAQTVSTGRIGEVGGLSGFGDAFKVPAEFGTLKEFHPVSGTGNQSFVFHIQDAHANVDAQQNIKNILQWLEKEKGAKDSRSLSIVLEGAAGPLHPEYLRLFRDYPEVNEAVVQDLLSKGELNGVELFAWEKLKNSETPASIQGAEEVALYRDNLQTYREILFQQEAIETLLTPFRKQLEIAKSRILSPELRDFLRERDRRKFGNYSGDAVSSPQLSAYFNYLNAQAKKELQIDLDDKFEQVRFPNLVRLLVLERLEKTIDRTLADRQKKEAVDALNRKASSDDEKQLIHAFEVLDMSMPVRSVTESVWKWASDKQLDLRSYSEMWKSTGALILRSELEGEALFSEMELLEGWLVEKWIRSDDERTLVGALKDFELVEKLLALKWTPAEEERYLARPEETLNSLFGSVINGLLGTSEEDRKAVKQLDLSEAQRVELRGKISQAVHFYETARDRDEVLLQNTLKNSGPETLTVLVSGGFHTQGLTHLMREKNIGYAVIQPRISKNDNGALYQNVLKERNTDLSAYFRKPPLSKQEAVFFKAFIETAVPVLWEKYRIPHSEIGDKVGAAMAAHPVLAGVLSVKSVAVRDGSRLEIFKNSAPSAEQPAVLNDETVALTPNTEAPDLFNQSWTTFNPTYGSASVVAGETTASYTTTVDVMPAGTRVSVAQSALEDAGVRSELRLPDTDAYMPRRDILKLGMALLGLTAVTGVDTREAAAQQPKVAARMVQRRLDSVYTTKLVTANRPSLSASAVEKLTLDEITKLAEYYSLNLDPKHTSKIGKIPAVIPFAKGYEPSTGEGSEDAKAIQSEDLWLRITRASGKGQTADSLRRQFFIQKAIMATADDVVGRGLEPLSPLTQSEISQLARYIIKLDKTSPYAVPDDESPARYFDPESPQHAFLRTIVRALLLNTDRSNLLKFPDYNLRLADYKHSDKAADAAPSREDQIQFVYDASALLGLSEKSIAAVSEFNIGDATALLDIWLSKPQIEVTVNGQKRMVANDEFNPNMTIGDAVIALTNRKRVQQISDDIGLTIVDEVVKFRKAAEQKKLQRKLTKDEAAAIQAEPLVRLTAGDISNFAKPFIKLDTEMRRDLQTRVAALEASLLQAQNDAQRENLVRTAERERQQALFDFSRRYVEILNRTYRDISKVLIDRSTTRSELRDFDDQVAAELKAAYHAERLAAALDMLKAFKRGNPNPSDVGGGLDVLNSFENYGFVDYGYEIDRAISIVEKSLGRTPSGRSELRPADEETAKRISETYPEEQLRGAWDILRAFEQGRVNPSDVAGGYDVLSDLGFPVYGYGEGFEIPRAISIVEAAIQNKSPGVRSELRQEDWVAQNTPELVNYTVVSRQFEAGLNRDILEALEKKYGRAIANFVSQSNFTGGLGALMPDLIDSWKKNGTDIIAIHPLYNDKIKGIVRDLPEEITSGRKKLGDYLREILTDMGGDTGIEFQIKLPIGDDFRNKAQGKARGIVDKEFTVHVYKVNTRFGGTPSYYLDVFYAGANGEQVRVFDEVYPDSDAGSMLWRDVHMGTYALATEKLVQILQKQGDAKENLLFVDNEVFASMPTPLLPKALHHHINHTVFRPGLYRPDESSFEMLGYPEWMRPYIVREGKINVTDAVALNSDVITGVGLYEHTPVLGQDGIFSGHLHKLTGYNKDGVRSTNGVLLDQWQAPEKRALIQQYKAKLSLSQDTTDREFFKALDGNQALLSEFQIRSEYINAAYVGLFYSWLAGEQKNPLWLNSAAAEIGSRTGSAIADPVRHVNDFLEAIRATFADESKWDAVKAFDATRDVFIEDPIVSNVRRQVPYKGPEKWIEVLESLRGNQEAIEDFRKNSARVVIGGRIFDQGAYNTFQRIKDLIQELGLQDRIVTVENYSIQTAPIIFQAMAGVVMLSDEFLEASATSMMKGLANRARLIGVWGGADPELFTIVETATGREIDVFGENVTHDQLVENLDNGTWKITNGHLVRYAAEVSHQVGGGRRPSAASLAQALKDLRKDYGTPESRRTAQYDAVASSYKVDIETSQARAHAYLWESAIKAHQRDAALLNGLAIPLAAAEKLLKKQAGVGFGWSRQPDLTKKETVLIQQSQTGLNGFLEGFRSLRMRGREALWSISYHASNTTNSPQGDIFFYILNVLLPAGEASLQPARQEIERLAKLAAETTDVNEKVELNLHAYEVLDQLALQLSRNLLDHYIAGDKGIDVLLQEPLVRENLVRYLDINAQPLTSTTSGIKNYAVDLDGQKVVVSINVGAFVLSRDKDQKAWDTVFGTDSFAAILGNEALRNVSAIYEAQDVVTNASYRSFSMTELLSKGLPIGVPANSNVQVLRLAQPQEQKLIEYFSAAVKEEFVGGNQIPADLIVEEIKRLREKPAQLREVLEKVARDLKPEDARRKFSNAEGQPVGVPAVMAFIAALAPDLLRYMREWNVDVYNQIDAVISNVNNRDIFDRGDIQFHRPDQKKAIVLSRVLGDRHVIVPVYFATRPYSQQDGKAWIRVRQNLDVLGIENANKEYTVRDHLLNQTYPGTLNGAELFRSGWGVGIPVLNNGPHFQMLTISPAGTARAELRSELDMIDTVSGQKVKTVTLNAGIPDVTVEAGPAAGTYVLRTKDLKTLNVETFQYDGKYFSVIGSSVYQLFEQTDGSLQIDLSNLNIVSNPALAVFGDFKFDAATLSNYAVLLPVDDVREGEKARLYVASSQQPFLKGKSVLDDATRTLYENELLGLIGAGRTDGLDETEALSILGDPAKLARFLHLAATLGVFYRNDAEYLDKKMGVLAELVKSASGNPNQKLIGSVFNLVYLSHTGMNWTKWLTEQAAVRAASAVAAGPVAAERKKTFLEAIDPARVPGGNVDDYEIVGVRVLSADEVSGRKDPAAEIEGLAAIVAGRVGALPFAGGSATSVVKVLRGEIAKIQSEIEAEAHVQGVDPAKLVYSLNKMVHPALHVKTSNGEDLTISILEYRVLALLGQSLKTPVTIVTSDTPFASESLGETVKLLETKLSKLGLESGQIDTVTQRNGGLLDKDGNLIRFDDGTIAVAAENHLWAFMAWLQNRNSVLEHLKRTDGILLIGNGDNGENTHNPEIVGKILQARKSGRPLLTVAGGVKSQKDTKGGVYTEVTYRNKTTGDQFTKLELREVNEFPTLIKDRPDLPQYDGIDFRAEKAANSEAYQKIVSLGAFIEQQMLDAQEQDRGGLFNPAFYGLDTYLALSRIFQLPYDPSHPEQLLSALSSIDEQKWVDTLNAFSQRVPRTVVPAKGITHEVTGQTVTGKMFEQAVQNLIFVSALFDAPDQPSVEMDVVLIPPEKFLAYKGTSKDGVYDLVGVQGIYADAIASGKTVLPLGAGNHVTEIVPMDLKQIVWAIVKESIADAKSRAELRAADELFAQRILALDVRPDSADADDLQFLIEIREAMRGISSQDYAAMEPLFLSSALEGGALPLGYEQLTEAQRDYYGKFQRMMTALPPSSTGERNRAVYLALAGTFGTSDPYIFVAALKDLAGVNALTQDLVNPEFVSRLRENYQSRSELRAESLTLTARWATLRQWGELTKALSSFEKSESTAILSRVYKLVNGLVEDKQDPIPLIRQTLPVLVNHLTPVNPSRRDLRVASEKIEAVLKFLIEIYASGESPEFFDPFVKAIQTNPNASRLSYEEFDQFAKDTLLANLTSAAEQMRIENDFRRKIQNLIDAEMRSGEVFLGNQDVIDAAIAKAVVFANQGQDAVFQLRFGRENVQREVPLYGPVQVGVETIDVPNEMYSPIDENYAPRVIPQEKPVYEEREIGKQKVDVTGLRVIEINVAVQPVRSELRSERLTLTARWATLGKWDSINLNKSDGNVRSAVYALINTLVRNKVDTTRYLNEFLPYLLKSKGDGALTYLDLLNQFAKENNPALLLRLAELPDAFIEQAIRYDLKYADLKIHFLDTLNDNRVYAEYLVDKAINGKLNRLTVEAKSLDSEKTDFPSTLRPAAVEKTAALLAQGAAVEVVVRAEIVPVGEVIPGTAPEMSRADYDAYIAQGMMGDRYTPDLDGTPDSFRLDYSYIKVAAIDVLGKTRSELRDLARSPETVVPADLAERFDRALLPETVAEAATRPTVNRVQQVLDSAPDAVLPAEAREVSEIATEAVLATADVLSAQLGIERGQALAMILKQLLPSETADSAQWNRVLQAAKEELGSDLSSRFIESVADARINFEQTVSVQDLSRSEDQMLVAFTLLSRKQHTLTFFLPPDEESQKPVDEETLAALREGIKQKVRSLGGADKAAERLVLISLPAGDENAVRKAMLKETQGVNGDRVNVVLHRIRSFLEAFGVVKGLSRVDRGDVGYSQANYIAGALLDQKAYNELSIFDLQQEMRRLGYSEEVVQRISRMIQVLQKISVAA